jgi:hypothetical protein
MKWHGQVFDIALSLIVALSTMLSCSGAFCSEVHNAAGTHVLAQAPRDVGTPLGQQGPATAVPDQQPIIYIFRKSGAREAIPGVAVDGIAVSEIFSGTYLKLTVRPGKHTVRATVGRHTASIELDTNVGETRYLEVSPKFSHLELVAVSKEAALSVISKGKAINPVEFMPVARGKYSKPELKAENERLKAAANQPANSPALPEHDSAASGTVTGAAPAPPPPTNPRAGAEANVPSSAGAPEVPTSSSSAAGTRLTDEQIQAAIQRGIDEDMLPRLRKPEWVRGSLGGMAQELYILSDSDWITWAADDASHEIIKVERHGYAVDRKKKAGFSFSIQDAKSSAVLLGVVTMIVEITGPTASKVAKWAGPGYHVALEADGKTIEPLTDEEYLARAQLVSGTGVRPIRPWNYKDFMSFTGCATFFCIYKQLVFPVIQGGQKLTVVITNADGHRREKEINPKLFEEQ